MEHIFENSRAQIGALKTELFRVDFYKRLYEICSIINCSGNIFLFSTKQFNRNFHLELKVFWVDNAQTGFTFIQTEPNKFSNCFKIFGEFKH